MIPIALLIPDGGPLPAPNRRRPALAGEEFEHDQSAGGLERPVEELVEFRRCQRSGVRGGKILLKRRMQKNVFVEDLIGAVDEAASPDRFAGQARHGFPQALGREVVTRTVRAKQQGVRQPSKARDMLLRQRGTRRLRKVVLLPDPVGDLPVNVRDGSRGRETSGRVAKDADQQPQEKRVGRHLAQIWFVLDPARDLFQQFGAAVDLQKFPDQFVSGRFREASDPVNVNPVSVPKFPGHPGGPRGDHGDEVGSFSLDSLAYEVALRGRHLVPPVEQEQEPVPLDGDRSQHVRGPAPVVGLMAQGLEKMLDERQPGVLGQCPGERGEFDDQRFLEIGTPTPMDRPGQPSDQGRFAGARLADHHATVQRPGQHRRHVHHRVLIGDQLPRHSPGGVRARLLDVGFVDGVKPDVDLRDLDGLFSGNAGGQPGPLIRVKLIKPDAKTGHATPDRFRVGGRPLGRRGRRSDQAVRRDQLEGATHSLVLIRRGLAVCSRQAGPGDLAEQVDGRGPGIGKLKVPGFDQPPEVTHPGAGRQIKQFRQQLKPESCLLRIRMPGQNRTAPRLQSGEPFEGGPNLLRVKYGGLAATDEVVGCHVWSRFIPTGGLFRRSRLADSRAEVVDPRRPWLKFFIGRVVTPGKPRRFRSVPTKINLRIFFRPARVDVAVPGREGGTWRGRERGDCSTSIHRPPVVRHPGFRLESAKRLMTPATRLPTGGFLDSV